MKAVFSVSVISIGQLVSAELPNITGSVVNNGWESFDKIDGAFYTKNESYRRWSHKTPDYECNTMWLDASRCSSIYKDSATTVVPESLITNFYIKY